MEFEKMWINFSKKFVMIMQNNMSFSTALPIPCRRDWTRREGGFSMILMISPRFFRRAISRAVSCCWKNDLLQMNIN